eukprot:TRINITY_DN1473_c0_g1_i1.p2 TRINITY_DN1473_c0_g1~~TRINITY_DN1473_c0_g1_i1.p2  ORF type:complete len:146 (-),score=5.85 TRINITY_DN1473_c0_g1_i1:89-526(-)
MGGKRKRSASGDSRGGSEDYEYYDDYSDAGSRSPSRRRDRRGGRDRGRRRDRDRRRRDRSGGRRRDRSRGRRGSGDWREDIEEFIRKNDLDKRTQDALATLDKSSALFVMGMDGGRNTFVLEGVRNPDAVVMSRIRNSKGGGGRR